MRKRLPWLLVLALCTPLCAQTAPPALMVKIDDASQPLGLVKMETDVRIFGRLAQTTSTMTFHNPLDRVMEGDLYFPLPEGATVSGYALDVEGTMVDGVAVEKRKGREVFEAIVRQGIDPGLVEWTRGNNFKTRVFPIPARGTRTVRVEYVTELIGGADEPAYHLPTSFSKRLRDFSLRVEVVKPKAEPKIAGGGLPNFTFEKWRDSFVAETRLRNVMLTEDLVVALPRVDEQNVLVEKADDGEVYFAVHDSPDPPPAGKKASPKHIVLYWDASGSRAGGDREREIGLVEAYLKSLASAASARDRMIHVDVMLIRNAQSKQKHFVVPAATPERIIDTLKEVRYDGGTQIGAITPKPGLPAPDFYMLFTDGISNFGQEEPGAIDAPVYIFSADSTADHALLHQLAMTTGGRYFNLKRMADVEVVSAIGQPAYGFLSGGGEGAKETCPGLPRPIAGRFTLVGKLDAEEASVRLQYGYQGKPVVKERSFTVSRDDAAKGSLLRRLWAQTKLADLMTQKKRNEEEIVALGKEHGLVTPFTSLIVLDSLEQYVEYEIAPPKSLPEMRDEYMRQVDTLEFQERKQKADKLGQVVEMWEARIEWWNTVFEYPKDFKYNEPDQVAPEASAPRGGGMGGMPLPSLHRAPLSTQAADAMSTPAEEPAAMPMDFEADLNLIVETVDPESWERAGEESPGASRRQPGIVIKPWDPETPYMKKLKAAGKGGAKDVYLESRAEYGTSPAFFLDCADYFFENREPRLALRVLSNIAELELEEPALERVLAHRLAQIGYVDLAILTFERVLELRPEEPQSYRDLALVLTRRAERQAARAKDREAKPKEAQAAAASARDDYDRAIRLLNEVVLGEWDGRFAEIEVIALMELNAMLPKAKAAGCKKVAVDPRLLKLLDVDVRIVMTWHADNTDIDLWVIEPSGEQADYSHNRTTIGGLVSEDFTGGYGPEEYLVRKAQNGVYKIQANYFGSDATRLLGAVTVQVDVFTNFGRQGERRKSITVRLEEKEETVTLGQIEF